MVIESSLSVPQGFFILIGFWAFVSLIDQILKSSERYQIPYLSFLTENGLTVGIGKLNWFTERYNRLFLRISNISTLLFQKWFDVGVCVTFITCFGSIYFLATIPVNTLIQSESADEQILKPVIPGVNLPMTQMGYYLISMFFSALLHEIGHAVAAASEGVKVNGLGVFFFLLYPGAYVDIDTNSLNSTSKWRQLKIFTAGVWHNGPGKLLYGVNLFNYVGPIPLGPKVWTGMFRSISFVGLECNYYLTYISWPVFALFAREMWGLKTYQWHVNEIYSNNEFVSNVVICVVAALGLLALPYLLAPWYSVHQELTIIQHTDMSVVAGFNGLKYADIVTNIDQCKVNSTSTWRNCLIKAINNEQTGNCVSLGIWEQAELPIQGGQETECECAHFESKICFTGNDKTACLSAREVKSNTYCNKTQPCESDAYCMYPNLEEGSRLLSVGRTKGDDVIFMGHPALLHQSVILGEVVPKHPWTPLSPPYILEKLLTYFISLSGALAMLNVIPCYFLDGQYISTLVIDITLHSQSQACRDNLKFIFLTLGSLLLLVNIILAFYNLVAT